MCSSDLSSGREQGAGSLWQVAGHAGSRRSEVVGHRTSADQQGQGGGALCSRVPGAGQPAGGRGAGQAAAGRGAVAGCVRAGQHLGRAQQVRTVARGCAGLRAGAAWLLGATGARADDGII